MSNRSPIIYDLHLCSMFFEIAKAAYIEILFSLKQVLDMVKNPHYLHRMMVLRAISLMAPVMGSEITCSKFLPVVVEASKDR